MKRTGIALIDEIVKMDFAKFDGKRDWLQYVVNPAFSNLERFYSRTIDELTGMNEHLSNAEVKEADAIWSNLVARFRRLAIPLQALVDYTNFSKFDELILFTRNLQVFFLTDETKPSAGAYKHSPALMRSWIEQSPFHNRCKYRDIAEIIDAEILHIQLKWAILCSENTRLQTV